MTVCFLCSVRIVLADEIMGKCKCHNTFCKKHRLPAQHQCTHVFEFDASRLKPCVAAKI